MGGSQRDGVRIEQSMNHADGTPKGLETILKERGLLLESSAPKPTKKADYIALLNSESDIVELNLNPISLNLEDQTVPIKSWAEADGWFKNKVGERVNQKFVYPDGKGKGLKTIMKERFNWHAKKMTQQEMKELLTNQTDFQEQKEWLRTPLQTSQVL